MKNSQNEAKKCPKRRFNITQRLLKGECKINVNLQKGPSKLLEFNIVVACRKGCGRALRVSSKDLRKRCVCLTSARVSTVHNVITHLTYDSLRLTHR